MVSLPGPPKMRSLPPMPSMMSLPPNPQMTSASGVPTSTGLPFIPLSSPLVPRTVHESSVVDVCPALSALYASAALPLANVKANAAHTTAEILRGDMFRGSFALVSGPRHLNCARMSSRAHRPALLIRTDQNAGGLAHISRADDDAGVLSGLSRYRCTSAPRSSEESPVS